MLQIKFISESPEIALGWMPQSTSHYCDVIMAAMASQITSLTIVYLTVYRSKKTPKLRVSGLCAGNSPVTGEFPAQRASTRKMFPIDDVIMWFIIGSLLGAVNYKPLPTPLLTQIFVNPDLCRHMASLVHNELIAVALSRLTNSATTKKISCLLWSQQCACRWLSNWATHLQVLWQPISVSYDDIIKWKHFPRYWPFVRGIHRSPVNSPHKGQWRGALMFSLISTWINVWVNNREAGDLRRHRAHYDVIVMEMFVFVQPYSTRNRSIPI